MPGSDSTSARLLDEVVRDLARAFQKHEVEHALFGGLAVVLRGAPRLTTDIDFIVDVSAIRQPALFDELEALGATYGEEDGRRRTQRDALSDLAASSLTFLVVRGVRVDLLRPVDAVHRQSLDEAELMEWRHGTLRVVKAEHLILDKLIAGRGRDLDDVSRLARVHRESLDRTKIDPWLPAIEKSGGISENEARRLLGDDVQGHVP